MAQIQIAVNQPENLPPMADNVMKWSTNKNLIMLDVLQSCIASIPPIRTFWDSANQMTALFAARACNPTRK